MATKAFGDNGKSKPTGKPSAVGEAYDAPFRGYVNLSLTDDEKAASVSWCDSGSLWETFSFVVEDGVNLSIKRDPKSDGYIASATQRRSGSPNAGLVVTARGREAVVAFGRVLFCLAILYRKERWEDTQPIANPDRW